MSASFFKRAGHHRCPTCTERLLDPLNPANTDEERKFYCVNCAHHVELAEAAVDWRNVHIGFDDDELAAWPLHDPDARQHVYRRGHR